MVILDLGIYGKINYYVINVVIIIEIDIFLVRWCIDVFFFMLICFYIFIGWYIICCKM